MPEKGAVDPYKSTEMIMILQKSISSLKMRPVTRGLCIFLIIPVMVIGLLWSNQASSTDLYLAGDRITLHAREVPLTAILRKLANKGIVVQVDPGINPKITVSLENQDLRQGLDSILHSYSYALIWKSREDTIDGRSTLEELQIFKPGNKEKMRYLPPTNGFEITMDSNGDTFVRGEILVHISSAAGRTRLKQLLKQVHGTVIEQNANLGIYKIQVPDKTDIPSLAAQINRITQIEAEPNFVYASPPPYQLSNRADTETQPEAQPDNLIGDMPVAILDSGLIPDLGVDPFVLTSLDSLDPEAQISDSMGHGTQMAMIATGMVTPDGASKQSTDDFVPIIPVKIFDEQGLTSNFTLMQSLDFAMQNNARVISLSWGTETHSDFLEQTMDQAYSAGAIILAAGGRALLDDSSTKNYADYYEGGGRPKSRTTCSHSTIAIAGKNRPADLKQTRLNQWLHGDKIDYVDASGPVTRNGHIHQRRIAYVRGGYWVMIDDVQGKKKGTDEVDMYFQFAPGSVKLDNLTARTDFREGANLMVKVMEIPGLTAQQEEGWIAVEYKVVKPRPRVRFSIKEIPVRLTSLLYPYEGDVPDIVLERLTLPEDVQKKGVFGLRIRINGREDLIFFAPGQCEFSYQGTKLSGPVAYIQG